MSDFLRYFPTISYGRDRHVVKDLTKRVSLSDTLGASPFVYLPYVVKEGESPEELSFYYYGSVDFVWLVYLANNIIDPKYDWAMSQANLDAMIIDKYAEQANTSGREVLEWSKDRTRTDNVLFYENDDSDRITPLSFDLQSQWSLDSIAPFVEGEWTAVRAYDYEFNRNEDNRHVQLVDLRYAEQIKSEMKNVLRGI